MEFGISLDLSAYISVYADNVEEALDKVKDMDYYELVDYLKDYGSFEIGTDIVEGD